MDCFDWWTLKRDDLLDLTQNGKETPLYVYSQEIIQRQVKKLQTLVGIKQMFYAIKANPNPDILRFLFEQGFGFECVSPGELDFVINLFPDIQRDKRVLFTPNFAPQEEYEYGFSLGVIVNVDNTYPLEKWPSTFKDKPILLRIDPGTGRGHHDMVKTAGRLGARITIDRSGINSKFGISLADIPSAVSLISACQARVVGLHAHAGSGILKDPGNWEEVATCLYSLKKVFPDIKAINLGGGFGVVQNPSTDTPLDMVHVAATIEKFHKEHQDIDLWIEPGFNSLIRPMLYGSYHHIVNLSKLGQPDAWTVDLVGNICESGDIFGSNRELPQSEENDIILIAVAGAYGRSMSSDYNMRKPPKEIFLLGK